jgi:decaprenyl-phosphate phosphoribosyltransferase
MVAPLIKACRPHQWVKNLLFVPAPLVFARRIDDLRADARTAITVACFCLLSSAVYFLNDIVDRERDQAHPLKRHRPIASGALPVPVARTAATLFALVALVVAALLTPMLAAISAAYLLLNVAYSLRLKRIPFIDVACISLGYVLRVIAGAYAIDVPASGWLLLCTLLLASLLGFGKRAHELRVSGEKRSTQRLVLERYRPDVLRAVLLVLAGLTIAAYAAYTVSPHAIQSFSTWRLVFTVPFVAMGVIRFLNITTRKPDAESPTDSMLRDIPFMVNLVLYVLAIVFIIYGR